MTKTISSRQLAIMGFISSFALRLTTLPSLLYEEVKIDALFVMLIMMAMDIVEFLLIHHLLKKNQDVSFTEFLTRRFGLFFGKIILAFFYVFFLFKFLIIAVGGFEYTRFAIFKEAPLHLYVFVLISISFSFVCFKSKSFARTVEFFFPIIAWIFVGFLATAGATATFHDLRPLFLAPAQKIFETYFHYGITSGSYVFMLLFMGKIKFEKNCKKTFAFHLILANVLLISFYLINYSIFKYTAMAHPHAISEIIQFIPLPSLLGNFSWFAVSIMLLIYCFQAGMFAFCLCISLNGILQKRNEQKSWISNLCVGLTIALICFLIWKPFQTFQSIKVFTMDSTLFPIFTFITIGICYLLFAIEVVKTLFNKRKGAMSYEKTF